VGSHYLIDSGYYFVIPVVELIEAPVAVLAFVSLTLAFASVLAQAAAPTEASLALGSTEASVLTLASVACEASTAGMELMAGVALAELGSTAWAWVIITIEAASNKAEAAIDFTVMSYSPHWVLSYPFHFLKGQMIVNKAFLSGIALWFNLCP
jgi:hypothetical protein